MNDGRARLDSDRDGFLVFFVGVVLLSVAAAVYLLADLLVAAAPVVMLAMTGSGPSPSSGREALPLLISLAPTPPIDTSMRRAVPQLTSSIRARSATGE